MQLCWQKQSKQLMKSKQKILQPQGKLRCSSQLEPDEGKQRREVIMLLLKLWRRPGLHLNARTARAPSPVQACQGCQGELRHWLRPVQTDPPLRQHPLALALSIARARGQTRPDLTPFGAVCPKRHLRPMSTFQAFRAPQICPIFISFGSLLLFWLKKLVRRQASSTQIS